MTVIIYSIIIKINILYIINNRNIVWTDMLLYEILWDVYTKWE